MKSFNIGMSITWTARINRTSKSTSGLQSNKKYNDLTLSVIISNEDTSHGKPWQTVRAQRWEHTIDALAIFRNSAKNARARNRSRTVLDANWESEIVVMKKWPLGLHTNVFLNSRQMRETLL